MSAERRPGWDSLLLAVLVLALVQITGLAEQAALPTRVQDVLRHPILGSLLPAAGAAAMADVGPRPGDPIGLVLVALSLGLLLLYLVFDLALAEAWRSRAKAVPKDAAEAETEPAAEETAAVDGDDVESTPRRRGRRGGRRRSAAKAETTSD